MKFKAGEVVKKWSEWMEQKEQFLAFGWKITSLKSTPRGYVTLYCKDGNITPKNLPPKNFG